MISKNTKYKTIKHLWGICFYAVFYATKDKYQAGQKIIKRHLTNNYSNLQSLRIKHEELKSYLLQIPGKIILRILLHNIAISLRINNSKLKVKNKKIYHLKPKQPPFNYQIPIVNFSWFEIDAKCLIYRLHHSFSDNSRFIKR